MGIFDILKKNYLIRPGKIALIIDDKEYSYEEFYFLVLQTIKNLKKNKFNKNSIVLLIEDNSLTHILTLFALSYLNATIVPTGSYYSDNHLIEIYKITKSNSLIGNKYYCELFKKKNFIKKFLCSTKSKKFSYFFKKQKKYSLSKSKILSNKDYIITMSSGSTSKPKPIVYSQSTKIIRFNLFKNLYKLNYKDTVIVTCPIDHSLGMRILFLPFLMGGTCVVMKKFNKSLYYNLVKKYKVSFSVLVSNQLEQIIKDKKNFNSFFIKKGIVSASAKLYNSTKKKFIKKKMKLYEMYGAAEVGTITSINLLENKNKTKFKSVGTSYNRNINFKILSDHNSFLGANKIGEIICRSPGRLKYYLNKKKKDKNDFFKGYFKTGDLGYKDKDNYLYFLSRKKNIIRRNGITIYPEDLESIFLKHKFIKEVCVIGIEKNYSTEIIIFAERSKYCSEFSIREHCLKNLSSFQMPNKICIINKFPRTNLGKIQKYKLKELFI